MAIGFASQPVAPIPIQLQTYQLPTDYIVQGLANAQNIQDTYMGALESSGDPMYNIQTLADQDAALLKQKQQDYETRLNQWAEQDLRKQGREISRYIKGIARDPELKALEMRQSSYQNILKQRDEALKSGKWKDWQMYPVNKALQDYQSTGQFDPNFTLPTVAPYRDVDERLVDLASKVPETTMDQIVNDIQGSGIDGIIRYASTEGTPGYQLVDRLTNALSVEDLRAIQTEAEAYGIEPKELLAQKVMGAASIFAKTDVSIEKTGLDGSTGMGKFNWKTSPYNVDTAYEFSYDNLSIPSSPLDVAKQTTENVLGVISSIPIAPRLRNTAYFFGDPLRESLNLEEGKWDASKVTAEDFIGMSSYIGMLLNAADTDGTAASAKLATDATEEFIKATKEAEAWKNNYENIVKQLGNDQEDLYSPENQAVFKEYVKNMSGTKLFTPKIFYGDNKWAAETKETMQRNPSSVIVMDTESGDVTTLAQVVGEDYPLEGLRVGGRYAPDNMFVDLAESYNDNENINTGQFAAPYSITLTDEDGLNPVTLIAGLPMSALQNNPQEREMVLNNKIFRTASRLPGVYNDLSDIGYPDLKIMKVVDENFNPTDAYQIDYIDPNTGQRTQTEPVDLLTAQAYIQGKMESDLLELQNTQEVSELAQKYPLKLNMIDPMQRSMETAKFYPSVVQMARNLSTAAGKQLNPEWFLGVFMGESGMDASAVSPNGRALGLNQIIAGENEQWWKNLGIEKDEYISKTPTEQLATIEAYYQQFAKQLRYVNSKDDLHLLTAWPIAMDKSDNYVISTVGDAVYVENPGWRSAYVNGKLTKANLRALLTK